MKNRYALALCSLMLVLSVSLPNTFADVKAWEGSLTVPTYSWGPDDLNPKFFALEDSIIYPYNMQDHLSNEKENHTYKALFLENEYLKITCLPELGGRIHSVFDKTTDREMFHTNKVIKPGLIAMRGAWISGGIEWNTGPHGHTVTAVSPVDAMLHENPDGSASLIVNNIEKIFRTRWTVKLTLHPGRSYLDEEIRMYNPNDGLHPYYFWNCTAFYNKSGTRFIYPMTLGCDHSGHNFFTWPIDNGKDITYLKNYDRPTSVFAYNCPFDFFGAYDIGMDRGIVQTANHHTVIGKKAWTWGKSDDGIVSQKNLHDFGEEYIEVQSGPLLTQADYGLLEPHQEVTWHEYWYPVHGLGEGYEYANKNVAVQTIRKDSSLELRIISTAKFPDAKVSLSVSGTGLGSKNVGLTPEHPVSVTFDNIPNDPCSIVIHIPDSSLPLTSFITPLPIPVMEEPELPWWETKRDDFSIEEMYFKALLYDKQTNRPAAREWYEKVLAEDPLHAEANRQLGVLDLEAGLFPSAIAHFEKTLERNPDDALAWYYLGSAALKTGDYERAESCGYKTVKYRPESSQGYDLAGRALLLQNPVDYKEGIGLLQKAVEQNPDDTAARNHLLMAAMKWDFLKRDAETIFDTIAYDPDPSDVSLVAIESVHRSGKVPELIEYLNQHAGEVEFELLEAVNDLMELGLDPQAFEVMTAIEEPKFNQERSALSYYYLAYLAHRLQKSDVAGDFLELAMEQTPDYVFPSRVETIPVLQYAVETNASDANAYLLLGNLLGGLGRIEEARPCFEKAAALNDSLSVAQRNLGYIAWMQDKKLDQAEAYYRHAIAARPGDQTLYRDLVRILLQDNKRQDAIALMVGVPAKDRRSDIVEYLSQAYVDEKAYGKAIELLSESFFSNWENRTMSRNVYERAHLERGKQLLEQGDADKALQDFEAALLYPEHLGVGRPASPEEAEPYYWKGRALDALGKTNEAKAAWKTGAEGRRGSRGQNRFVQQCKEALGG